MNVSDTFGRAADELAMDRAFADVEVVTRTARRVRGAMQLTLVVDRPGGVDIALCERIASRLNAVLETATEAYTLEVESAGLDRPLAKPQDFQRFAGSDVKVVTNLTIQGAKTHRGRLLGVRGTNVVLQTAIGELPLPLPTVKSANLEFDIRADLRRAKQERRRK